MRHHARNRGEATEPASKRRIGVGLAKLLTKQILPIMHFALQLR